MDIIGKDGKVENINIGDKIRVYGSHHIKIANPEGIASDNYNFIFDDDTIIKGGDLEALAVKDNKVLLRYYLLEGTGGTLCPSGALVYLNGEEFCNLTEAIYNAHEEERERIKRRNEVIDLLASKN